ncbi:MAG: immunoglobulin domain-containing protein [Opitutaceae bacterium]
MLFRFTAPLVFSWTLAGIAAAQPLIVEHPAGVSAYPGDQVTLKASASSSQPLTYQWRKDGAVIAGAVQPTLALTASLTPPATTSSALYTLEISDGVATVTTIPAAVFVTRRPQTITFNAPASAASASSVTLEATASSGLPVSFAIASGAGSLAGRILTGNGGPIVVRATQAGSGTFEPAAAVERTIAFISGAISPFITIPPPDQTVLAGTAVALRTVSIGTPAPTYQWAKNGAVIAGATDATLTLATVALADAGRYTVTAANVAGTSTASAELIVRAAPVVVTPPATQAVVAGRSVTLSAVVTGFPAPAFQWRKDGRAIAGATRAELALSGVTSAAAGSYDVVATNALGSVTSAAAIITVTLRDFSGTYRGSLGSGAGEIALFVRPNGPATVLAHFTAAAAGLSATAIAVDLNGNFSATVPLIAASARNVTLRGAIDETAGTITGAIAELNLTFTATRAEPASPVPDQAGLYFGGVIGGATAAGAVVGPDGRAFALLLNGPAVDSASGSLSADGRLAATTNARAALDLGFTSAGMRGSLRPAGGVASTLVGVPEAQSGRQHLVNLSVRGATAPEAPLITGFAIGGTTAKQVLIRVAGPALARAPFNLTGALADPALQLYRVSTVIGQNNDWGSPASGAAALTAAATRAGAFPFVAGSADAALLTTLPPGVYSVQTTGGTGFVLAEVYEVPVADEAPGSRRLVNVSTLGPVAPGVPLIAGFVIEGPGPQRVLVRAAGATLAGAPFNLAGALPNPQLVIFQGATQLKSNDDWFREAEAAAIRDAATRANAFAFGAQSLDSALLLFLEPGAYTAVISASAAAPAAQATGLALVEIYDASP